MKLVRYLPREAAGSGVRPGVLIGDLLIGDLRTGYADYLLSHEADPQAREIAERRLSDNFADIWSLGRVGRDALTRASEWMLSRASEGRDARDRDGTPLFAPVDTVTLLAPVVPRKIVAVGRNYRAHLKEAGVEQPMSIPSTWIKASSSMTGPFDDVVKPVVVRELDYETELTIVIGERCKNVPEAQAYDVVAGYTILNDVSARDVVRRERAEGNQMLGKMFDGFAPTGPWIVTADEIADPMNLRLVTRVNGEIRQNSTTANMIWSIPKLVAFVSQMTLEPGDLITTGTPEGVALGHKGEPSWFLKHGDVVESEIEGIGTMRNTIVDAAEEGSWTW